MHSPLRIVADAHIWGVESAFSHLNGIDSELTILENRDINHDALLACDILLTRSSTKVDAALLAGTPVRFAATATIGDDHYDKAWLNANNVVWANAAGSSTGSVIEYMATALLLLHQQGAITIPDTTIGIIGVGRIGSRLAELCEVMGMQVLRNDPPRARSEGQDGFVSLDEVLQCADIISLHTPMIRAGDDATLHLLSEAQLSRFSGTGIINAARGGCIDNPALLAWLEDKQKRFAMLDCWEHEPTPMQQLFGHPRMRIATPHIAGHSLDGKAANTLYIYQALCSFLGIEETWDIEQQLPSSPPPIEIHAAADPWQTLCSAALQLYPLSRDHNSMKSWNALSDEALKAAFTGYRRHYPARRAWDRVPLHINNSDAFLQKMAHAFGMKMV